MFFFNENTLPTHLLNMSYSEDDINVIIGENGAGKSTLLNHLAIHFLAIRNVSVIAIANTIHDIFSQT